MAKKSNSGGGSKKPSTNKQSGSKDGSLSGHKRNDTGSGNFKGAKTGERPKKN